MNIRLNSLEVMNNHQSELENGNAELKRHFDQTKRLGNERYKTHPQLNGVKSAVQSLQPDQLLKILKDTHKALEGKGGTVLISDKDVPQLQEPELNKAQSSDKPKLTSSAAMTALLAKITQLTTDASLNNLVSQLQSFNAMMDGVENTYSQLAEKLEQLGETWARASDALKELQKQADFLSHDVDQALSALHDAQSKLNSLEEEAAAHNPVPESLKKQIDIAKTVVASAQTVLTQVTTTKNNFVDNVLNPAINAEQNARCSLVNSQLQSTALIKSLSPQQQIAIEQRRKQADEQSKTLTFLMALMSQLIDKSSSDDLRAMAELKQKLSEASAKDAEKKAKEYEQEVRKAEDLQKTMGCIGKVLGWLITAFSFAAAIFTGGASLALAAVGLALAVGDEISQAVSGRSFMADAMQPLMDAVVKPLMELMGKMFSAILEACGVDKATAEMVGQILGAIAAAAVLVAGVMVAGSAMSKAYGVLTKKIGMETSKAVGKNMAVGVEKEVVKEVTKNLMKSVGKETAEEVAEDVAEQVAKTTIQRLMDSSIAQMIKRLSQGIGRSMGMNEVKMATVANRTEMAMIGARMVNTTIQTAGGIAVANIMVEASKVKAQMIKDVAMQELLNEMMSRTIDAFSHRMDAVNSIVKNISAVAENQMQAGKYITKQISTVAG